MSRHFSLNAWHPFGDRGFWLIRIDTDWFKGEPGIPGWFTVTVGLLGFCLRVTYWPMPKGNVPSAS